MSPETENTAALRSAWQHKHTYMCIYIHRCKHTYLVTDQSAHAQLWVSYFLPCGLLQGTCEDKKLGDDSTQLSTHCLFWAAGITDTWTRAEGHRAAMLCLQGALGRFNTVQGVKSTPSQRTVHGASLVRARWVMCYSTFFTHLLEDTNPSGGSRRGSPHALPERRSTGWSLSVPPKLGSRSVSVFKAKARRGQVLFLTLKNTMSFG